MLSTAQKYIARRYEQAVDLGLDLDALRAYLLAHGIKHTPAQVVHQLDNVLCFAGYAASHPAPVVDVRAYDRTTARKDWINPLAVAKAGVYNCLTVVRQSYTPGATT